MAVAVLVLIFTLAILHEAYSHARWRERVGEIKRGRPIRLTVRQLAKRLDELPEDHAARAFFTEALGVNPADKLREIARADQDVYGP